jgi:UDP-N-acetylmuramate dehydrogenase
MSLFSDFDFVQENVPLAPMTWYGVGGNARYFASVSNENQLSSLMKKALAEGIRYKILGHGSNVLISDEGFDGLVIRLTGEFCEFKIEDSKIIAGAGVNLSKLVLESIRAGLGGLESLTGIPGSIGGAVRMNAGGKFGEIGTAVESVRLMDAGGNCFTMSKPELLFNYRDSNVYDSIILSATFALTPSPGEELLKRVQEIWIYKKNNQPASKRSAGCVFRNCDTKSAGEIIEYCGLKGATFGKAKVSMEHANIITTEEGCTGADVRSLIDKVKEKVREITDIDLQLEIDIW